MNETIFGIIILLLILLYFIYLAVKLILIGTGRMKDIHEMKFIRSNSLLVKGIIALLVTVPFAGYLLFLLFMVFAYK